MQGGCAAYLFRYVQAVNNGGGSPGFRGLMRKECVGIQPGKYQLPDPAGRGYFLCAYPDLSAGGIARRKLQYRRVYPEYHCSPTPEE